MFDVLYEQTYTLRLKYLVAMLDMFNPQIAQLPDDATVDEMIEEEYIIYDRENKTFRLAMNYRMLLDCFLSTNSAVNIEAPKVKAMNATLSLYYLSNRRHMLVLIHQDDKNADDGLVEVAISSKKSSATKLFESVGADIVGTSIFIQAESFDSENLPIEYKECYDDALENNTLFRVTLYDQESDGEDGALGVFAAFPSRDQRIWLTAMHQKFSKKKKPVLVQKLCSDDYKKYLPVFFDLFEKQIR